MTSQHSPTPWVAKSFNGPVPDFMMFSAVNAGGEFVLAVGAPDRKTTTENLDRIIACVNACEGIPTEELPKLKAWIDNYRRLYQEGGTAP
jgi:hypothetical protein